METNSFPEFQLTPRENVITRRLLILFGSVVTGIFLFCLTIIGLNYLSLNDNEVSTILYMAPWMLCFAVLGIAYLFYGIHFQKLKSHRLRWFLLLSILLDALTGAYMRLIFLRKPTSDSQFEGIVSMFFMISACLIIIAFLLTFQIIVGKKLWAIDKKTEETISFGR